MKKTIFGEDTSTTSTQLSDNEPETVALAAGDCVSPSDMDVNDTDGLGWLDGKLPNLSSVSHYQFDLKQEFCKGSKRPG
jgi:uncharacterized phage infection (PIP) family protein YhgE